MLGVFFCVALPMVGWLENRRARVNEAVHLEGWTEDWGQGEKEAGEKGRMRLVLFTADWCPPCQTLKREVLTQGDVTKYLEDHFVRVKVDLTSPNTRQKELGARYEVEYIPTMAILDDKGEVKGKTSGSMEKGRFLEWVKRYE